MELSKQHICLHAALWSREVFTLLTLKNSSSVFPVMKWEVLSSQKCIS